MLESWDYVVGSRGVFPSIFRFILQFHAQADLSHQINFWLDYKYLDEFYVTQIYQKVEIVVK